MALGLAAMFSAAALHTPPAMAAAVGGPAALSPGNNYQANIGDTFTLDFSNIFAQANSGGTMSSGNSWQFDVAQNIGNVSFSNLGWETTTDSGATWSQVDWSTLDPMGAISGTTSTTPALVASQFPGGTKTISLTLGQATDTLVSAFLPKANYPNLNGVRMVGTVLSGSAPYYTEFSISDVSASTTGAAPQYHNAFQADLYNEVPGPLPVLGAASAFGMARRLRRRVKEAALS
jgi:hypothetical protein